MDKRMEKMLAGMVAMITALAELDGGWMPRSMLYIAMGTDLAISEMAIQVAERAGYVTATAETVAITNEGREKAAEIERALERARASA